VRAVTLIISTSLYIIIAYTYSVTGVPNSLTKKVKYFSFFRGEIVIVNIELSLYLNTLIYKSRVYFIK